MLIKFLLNWMIVFCCYVFLWFMDSLIYVFFLVNGKFCFLEMSNNIVFCVCIIVFFLIIFVIMGDYVVFSVLILF